MKKCIGQFFSFSIEYDQPQGTIFFGSTRYLETYCAKDKIVFFFGIKEADKQVFQNETLSSRGKNGHFLFVQPTIADKGDISFSSTIY